MNLKIDMNTGSLAEQAHLLGVLAAAYPDAASYPAEADTWFSVDTGPMLLATISVLPIDERHAGDYRDEPVQSPPCSGGPFQPDRTAS